eukprot:scaffold77_cov116-Isochrysis_galbana.AAC.16
MARQHTHRTHEGPPMSPGSLLGSVAPKPSSRKTTKRTICSQPSAGTALYESKQPPVGNKDECRACRTKPAVSSLTHSPTPPPEPFGGSTRSQSQQAMATRRPALECTPPLLPPLSQL